MQEGFARLRMQSLSNGPGLLLSCQSVGLRMRVLGLARRCRGDAKSAAAHRGTTNRM